MYLRKTILLLFCLLSALPLFSQSEDVIVFYENDLATEKSSYITQCNQGYIWSLNERTLYRFDGKKYWQYPNRSVSLIGENKTFKGLHTYQDSLLFLYSDHNFVLLNPVSNTWQNFSTKIDGNYYEINSVQQLKSGELIIHAFNAYPIGEMKIWRFKDQKLIPIELPEKLVEVDYLKNITWLTIDAVENKYIFNMDTLKIFDPSNHLIAKIQLDSFISLDESSREFKRQFDLNNQLNILIDEKLYILNESKNALLLHPFYKTFKSSYSTSNIFINDFFYEKNGNAWIQCEDVSTGKKLLFYYEPFKNKIQDFSDKYDFTKNNINQLFQDRTDVVWFSTDKGLGKIALFSEPLKEINNYRDDNTWGDTQDGIMIYPYFSNFLENRKGEIYAVLKDNILRFDPEKGNDADIVYSNVDRGIDIHLTDRGLLLSSGRLLDLGSGKVKDIIGAHPKIDSLNDTVKHFTFFRWDKNYYKKILKEGTYSKSNYIFKKYYSDLILEDKNQTIWRANDSTLYYLDQSENDWIWRKELSSLIRSTKEEQIFKQTLKDSFNLEFEELLNVFYLGKTSNKFWLGYRSGKLISYSPRNKKLEQFEFLENEKYLSINAIHEDSNGILWLATSDGLVYFNPKTNERKRYGVEDGLFDNSSIGFKGNSILALEPENETNLILSTAKVISKFNIPTGTFINNFSKNEGIDYRENFQITSSFKSSKGEMFFGKMTSIVSFFPKSFFSKRKFQSYKELKRETPFVLSSFEYADENRDTIFKNYNLTNHAEITLEHGSKSLTFEYVLTDFRASDKVEYSYKLEGDEDIWSIPSTLNITRFVSLPAGSYTFRVKAKDEYGIWYPKQLAIKIIILPPWWKTNWAYFIYFLIFAGLTYVAFYFVKKRLKLQAQLKREQEEALRLKELDNFKSKLYTNLTHEFRTPLTVILGMVQQIRNEPKKYLDEGTRMIETNGRNLLRLINQLLDLSKLEDRSFQLKLQQSDIIPYLKYITESFHTYVNSKNLSLQFFTTEESLIMDHDPEQIKQVMTNLISNAVKFTPSGGEVIVRIMKENEQLKIEVKDTGIGIAEDDLVNIFDRFYQVDGSMTREGEGTGIGLAHTQELVKLMGGKISVNSVLEKGSTFIIHLPIRNQASIEKTILKKETTNKINLDLKNLPNLDAPIIEKNDLPQLLIIEDNHDVVVYLKSCLENFYQIDVAYNGQIGIEKAIEHIPDLIISDVMMPQKNGFEVCDFLKNDERTSHIPIILLTAKADADSKIVGLKRGADAYLSKPFDKEELIIRLEKLVERQQKMRTYFSSKTIGKIESIETEGIEEAIQIEDAFIQKIKKIIEENYSDENFALPQLCQKIRMSRSQLFRKMKALVDTSPSNFIRTYRLEKAKHLLETTDMNVSEVSWEVGFKDVSHFSKTFQSEFGYLPSATNK